MSLTPQRSRIRAVVLLGVLACAVGAARPDAAGGRSPLVIARNHTHAFHLFAPAVATKRGYFQNVDVQLFPRDLLPEFLDGDELARAMAANNIDVVVDARARTIFSQTQPRVCIVGGWQIGTIEDIRLVSVESIHSVRDLRGKRVGTSDLDSESVAMLQYRLLKEGLDPGHGVTWVTGLPRNMRAAQALRDGKADAAFVAPADAERLIAEGRYRQLLKWGELYPAGRVERVMAARCEVVEKRPADLKNFLKGMVRAYRLIDDWAANEDFLAPAWDAEVARIGDPDRSAAAGENYKTIRLSPDGSVPPKAMAIALEEQKALGRAKADLELASLLRLEPVEDALKELEQDGTSP